MEAVLNQEERSTFNVQRSTSNAEEVVEHPTYPKLRAEAWELMGVDWCERYNVAREAAIAAEKENPLLHGYEPQVWKLADFHRAELRRLNPVGVIHEVDLGGNRASKTERAAKRIIQFMLDKPGARVWCGDSTEAQSNQNQQALLWKYFPVEWKNKETGRLKRDAVTQVNYTQGRGFSTNDFVFPNGSQCWFKFYGMDIDDLEGPELDIFWGDELIPLEWIDTLVYRLITRNGLMHVTFTPKKGYTPTVGHYLEGSRLIEEVEADLLPKLDKDRKIVGHDKVPRVKFCQNPRARVIYFHTGDNPYGNYPAMVEEVKNKPRTVIRMRVYGDVDKAAHTQFNYKDSVDGHACHTISMNRWVEIVKAYPNGTLYQLVDPCSGRNWFWVYAYFPFAKKCIICGEWPSTGHPPAYVPGHGDLEEWALPSKGMKKFDGEPGPAQDSIKFSLQRYKEEMLRVESLLFAPHGLVVYERWMDARYGNTRKTEKEAETTLIEQMEDIGMRFNAMDSEKNIIGANDGSIDMINSALYYDGQTELGKFSAELGRNNEPWLQVTENCPNMIFANKTWTGKDGQHGACKDPIDCERGLFLSELGYRDQRFMRPHVPMMERRR